MSGLAPDSVALLLDLMESRDLLVTAGFVERMGPPALSLREHGLLVEDGHEMTVAGFDGDDPVSWPVVRDEETGELGWLDADCRWHKARKDDLQRYRLDVSAVMSLLLGKALRLAPGGPKRFCDGLVWQLGRVQLSSGWFDLLVVRRLSDPACHMKIAAELKRLGTGTGQVVLTTTPGHFIPAITTGFNGFIPIADVLSLGEAFRIDPDRLSARFEGRDVPETLERVTLSADGKRLMIDGTVMTCRGKVITSLVRQLVETWRTGKPRTAINMLKAAGSEAQSLDKVFRKRWPMIRPWLVNENGYWRLDPDGPGDP